MKQARRAVHLYLCVIEGGGAQATLNAMQQTRSSSRPRCNARGCHRTNDVAVAVQGFGNEDRGLAENAEASESRFEKSEQNASNAAQNFSSSTGVERNRTNERVRRGYPVKKAIIRRVRYTISCRIYAVLRPTLCRCTIQQ